MKKDTLDYGYYSKLLNKPFDSVEELKAAEETMKAAEEAKQAKAKAKKDDATKVENAFKSLNEAKKTYNKEVIEAKKAYAKIIADAKDVLNKCLDASEKKLDEAQAAYSEALKEFTDKHPEGYHVTLKDGDNITTLHKSVIDDPFMSFNKLFDSFFSGWI